MRVFQRSQRGVEKSPPLIITRFWEPNVWLGLSLERVWEYCEEPWLLHSVERVYFFGVAGVLFYNVPLLGLVVVHGVCRNGTFTYNNKI